jgi:hypothetical protein
VGEQTVCFVGRAGCSTKTIILLLSEKEWVVTIGMFKVGEQAVRPTVEK